ncbi:hypothetical protein [Ignatzschineria sp. LJL83]
MIEERQAQSQGVSPALASELITQNIHPDQYIPKPKESLYRYIYRPDGSYEPLAQIRKLTAEDREAAQQNNPHYRQIPDYRLPEIFKKESIFAQFNSLFSDIISGRCEFRIERNAYEN